MDNDLESIGLDAVDKFLQTFNSRDITAWAGSLNFPHVRPSHVGKIIPFETEQEYISALNYDRIIASGWDHSEWDYKHVLHTCEQKIHVAGQWSRYTSNGEKLLSTPIVYIVTRQGEKWGIQARFSVDYVEDGDTADMETRGFKLIHDFINRSNEGNAAACAELINYPHFEIGQADLMSSVSMNEFKLPTGNININSLYAIQTGAHCMNAALDINIAADGENHLRQLVLNINDRHEHLGIQAWSALNPAEEPH